MASRSFIFFSSAATTQKRMKTKTMPWRTVAAAVGPVQLSFLVAIFGMVNSPNWLRIVSASPDPTPHLRLDGTLDTLTESVQVVNLTRQHDGDVFMANELLPPTCNMDTCVGLSSGTAGLFVASREADILSGHEYSGTTSPNSGINANTEKCQCRCLQHLNTYREDLGICVDDIHECTLSPFVSGSTAEKIPFVFLPLRGQIIHPSREINFPGVRTPVCAVTSAQYLTQKGWMELRNPLDSDVPFRLFRDEGRTFLQWLGESDLRQKMQGRLILIHMMCRDMASSHTTPGHPSNGGPKNLFTPCVAFRVNGSPVRFLSNVPEVLFQSENSNLSSAPPEGFHTREYIVIGICSLILGLIYVASVFLYLHVKKRKAHAHSVDGKPGPDSKTPKNDQVTFGAPFSRTESFYSGIADARNSQRSNRSNIMGGGGGVGSAGAAMTADDMGLIKNNPLLRHFVGLNENSGFMHTSAIVHPGGEGNGSMDGDRGNFGELMSANQDNECLPEENVSITEDTSNEDKLDSMKAIVNGTVRKKLYFNPAYFEPHLLMSPPPAAIEFLTKIREVIAIAKYKMATKRYQPSLNIIPEEHGASQSDIAAKANTPPTNTLSAKTEQQNNRLGCSGCPGCNTATAASKCGNCGDKHQSIQKWLEGVHFNECQQQQSNSNDLKVTSMKDERINKIEEVREKNETDSAVVPKKKVPPPLPLTAPKIISHSLKPNIVKVAPPPPPSKVDPPIYIKTTNIRATTGSTPSSPTKRNESESVYGFRKATSAGSEIYNNPKFLESPQLSVRSKTSSSRRSRCTSKKHVEIMDQYSNSGKERESAAHYEMLKSIQNMPDMVYEALAKDYETRNFNSAEKNSSQQLYNIPTPDYDGTYRKKLKDIYNNSTGSGPFVPTPDYSTMSKRSLRQYQPDSPVYRRRSPQYLIVDYETDSLERGSSLKKDMNSSSPSSNNSSDISSQPSPSLSTALPLEEEVEVHHTVYDKVEGFRKDGDSTKRIIADYESRHRGDVSPKIKYDTFRGSMTIEVAHEPHSDEVSTDSDQFEPDTLDRKPKKQNNGSFRSLNAWTEYLNKSQSFVNSNDKVSYSSLENMTSLPEFTVNAGKPEPFILRTSSSFRSESGQIWDSPGGKLRSHLGQEQRQPSQNFGSLREIYQSKVNVVQQQTARPKVTSLELTDPSDGRILTLDAKHSKRQRQVANDKIKKLIPPDVIPADSSNNMYYDIPRRSAKVDGLIVRKNLEGWSTSDSSGDTNTSNETSSSNRDDTRSSLQDDSTDDTMTSDQSESTEITGVSDTQINSDRGNNVNNQKPKLSNSSFRNNNNDRILQIDYSAMYNKQKQQENNAGDSAQNSFISVKIGNDNAYQTYHFNSNTTIYTTPDTIVQSDQLLTNDDHRDMNSQRIASPITDLDLPIHGMHNIQRVYRVEVPPPSNGMQIAIGLRDRAKKSKDLKNAWKKFVSMATGKFNGPTDASDKSGDDCCKDATDSYDPKSGFSDYIDRDRDEGISSLVHEDNIGGGGGGQHGIRRSRTSGGSLENVRKTYYQNKSGVGINRSQSTIHHDPNRITLAGNGIAVGPYRQDMDSGYISGDECKPYTQRVYEQQANSCDVVNIINTNPDTEEPVSTRQFSARRRPQTPKHASMRQRQQVPATVVKSNDRNIQLDLKHPSIPSVSVYSSDDEPYLIPTSSSSESDDGGNTEDMCESGAESVETHSVLYKNIRYRER